MRWLRVAGGLAGAAVCVAFALLFRRPQPTVTLHRWLCAVLRVRVRRFGEPGPGRRLIVANHVSWLDPLVLGAMEPMAFLAKKEVGADPRARGLVNMQGAVYVDRARKRCIPQVNAEMARRMTAGLPVVLFAEATTSDGTRLLPFRSSHFEAARAADAVVQPVYLDYRRVAGMRTTRAETPAFAWYGDMTFWPSLKAVLASGGIACDVIYGEPFAADADRKTLCRRAESRMRAMKERARAFESEGFALEAGSRGHSGARVFVTDGNPRADQAGRGAKSA
jgi:1-acyl-sn-glycerol-3-phosphate acyltransferase